MNLWKLPLRAAETELGSPEPAPIVDPIVEPVADGGEPPAPELAPQPDRTPPAWALSRISEESARARAAEERAAEATRRANAAEELAQRLQAGQQQPPAPPAPAQDDRAAEIQRAAAQQRLVEDSTDVLNQGNAQFGAEFGTTLRILRSVGATTNDEFVSDVLAVDKANAHVLLHTIARDPEKALSLAQMNSRQRIAELTRMSMATAAAPAETTPAPAAKAPAVPVKQVSKAPAPAPAVTPSASKVVDWRTDEASDAEFDAGFNEMLKKRSAMR